MTSSNFTIYTSLTFLIVSFLVCFGYQLYQHEKIHQIIYEHNGIESEIRYHPFKLYVATYAYVKEGECDEFCEQSHEFNEIVGYNVQILLAAMFFCIFFWWFVTETRRLDDQYDRFKYS